MPARLRNFLSIVAVATSCVAGLTLGGTAVAQTPADSSGGAVFEPPPPPPKRAMIVDGRAIAPGLGPLARQARDRGGQPHRREALPLRRRPPAVRAPARQGLRLLRLRELRALRRPLPPLAASVRRAHELGPQRTRTLDHGVRARRSRLRGGRRPALRHVHARSGRSRAAHRTALEQDRSASRTPSWRATPTGTSAAPAPARLRSGP